MYNNFDILIITIYREYDIKFLIHIRGSFQTEKFSKSGLSEILETIFLKNQTGIQLAIIVTQLF